MTHVHPHSLLFPVMKLSILSQLVFSPVRIENEPGRSPSILTYIRTFLVTIPGPSFCSSLLALCIALIKSDAVFPDRQLLVLRRLPNVLKHVISLHHKNLLIVLSTSSICSAGTRQFRLSAECCHCSQGTAELVQSIHRPLSVDWVVEQCKLYHRACRFDCDRQPSRYHNRPNLAEHLRKGSKIQPSTIKITEQLRNDCMFRRSKETKSRGERHETVSGKRYREARSPKCGRPGG